MNTLLRRAALGMAFLVGFFLLGPISAVSAQEVGGGSDSQVDVKVDRNVERTVKRTVRETRETVTSASSDLSGEGNGGALSGNQAAAGNGSTSVGVGVCGNTVAVAGNASAECDGKQSTNKKNASSASNGRDAKRRILSANQAAALNNSSSVKVGVCGIAIAVAGEASGNCEGNQSSASAASLSSDGRNGNRSVLSDNQASALNGSPTGQVGVCGIALAVAGDATASCEGNQNSSHGSDTSLASTGAPNRAIGSGNQAAVANGSPTGQVAVCGVAVGVAGDSSANCEGNQSSANESVVSSDGSGDGNRDIASGNQAAAGNGSPAAQAGVCGVAIGVAGDTSTSCDGNQSSANADGTSLSNGDRRGIGSGNQVAALTGSPTAQAGVCGVAVGIAGDTSASCDGNRDSEADGSVSIGGSGDADRGIGSGNQFAALTGAPTAQGGVCAVAVGVAGDSSATCEGNQSSANDSSQSNGAGGEGGIGSGNQATALTGSPTAQAGVCAIVVTVAGSASVDCVGSQSSNNPIDSGGGPGTGGDPGSGGGPGTGGGPGSGGGAGSGGGGAIGDDGSGGAGPGFVDVASGPGFVALRPSVANGRYPLGGVQAGGGGTAREHVSGSPSRAVPGLIPAVLAIVLLTAGVTIRFAARRRHGEVAA